MSWDSEKLTDLPKVPARMNQSSVPNPISLGKLISSYLLHPFKTGPQYPASLYKKLTATELIHGRCVTDTTLIVVTLSSAGVLVLTEKNETTVLLLGYQDRLMGDSF